MRTTEYIKREYAVDAVVDVYYNTPDIDLSCEKFEAAILKIPSSDVAPVKHGRWIEYTKVIIPEPYNKWEQAWKCSKCGFDDGFVAYNYCPNYGAKMEGECDV